MFKAIIVLVALIASVSGVCLNGGIQEAGGCACMAGYTGIDCSLNNPFSTCAFPTALPLNTTIVAELANYMVQNDLFTFDILSDSYMGRYFDDISLAGNSSCSYPGPAFTHNFMDSPDCMDAYHGNFSIPDVVGCGFTTSNSGNSFLITGTIHVSANDDLGTFRGISLSRNTRSVLSLEISIPNTVFVNTSTPLTVFSSINPLYAVTGQVYDSANKVLIITLTSSVQWPYQLTNPTAQNANQGGAQPDANFTIVDNSNGCNQNSGDCFQDTIIYFSGMDSRCDVTGSYSFSWNYDCRTGQTPCPVDGSGVESATANIVHDNVCTVVTVAANIAGTLQSYPDKTYNVPQLVFVAGQTLFFLATFTSDVTIQSVSVNTVTVTQGQNVASLVISGQTQQLGTNAGFDDSAQSGNPDEFAFQFNALTGSGAAFIFDISSNQDAVFTFTVEATFDITYKTTFGRRRDTITESVTFKQRGVLDTSVNANSVHAALNSDGTNSAYKLAATTVAPFAFAAAAVGVVANL